MTELAPLRTEVAALKERKDELKAACEAHLGHVEAIKQKVGSL